MLSFIEVTEKLLPIFYSSDFFHGRAICRKTGDQAYQSYLVPCLMLKNGHKAVIIYYHYYKQVGLLLRSQITLN